MSENNKECALIASEKMQLLGPTETCFCFFTFFPTGNVLFKNEQNEMQNENYSVILSQRIDTQGQLPVMSYVTVKNVMQCFVP